MLLTCKATLPLLCIFTLQQQLAENSNKLGSFTNTHTRTTFTKATSFGKEQLKQGCLHLDVCLPKSSLFVTPKKAVSNCCFIILLSVVPLLFSMHFSERSYWCYSKKSFFILPALLLTRFFFINIFVYSWHFIKQKYHFCDIESLLLHRRVLYASKATYMSVNAYIHVYSLHTFTFYYTCMYTYTFSHLFTYKFTKEIYFPSFLSANCVFTQLKIYIHHIFLFYISTFMIKLVFAYTHIYAHFKINMTQMRTCAYQPFPNISLY